MAVQKSRVSRSKRGMRRAHDGLKKATLSIDVATGETHRRHHISLEGYYKGRQVITDNVSTNDKDDSDAE